MRFIVGILANLGTSFVLGLLTPLTAVCVLPLYPGFLAYLANRLGKDDGKNLALAGVLITAGAIIFMLLLGLLFTTFLEVSLTNVIGIISPIAFGILGVISLVLIFDVDMTRFLPKLHAPTTQHPLWGAFLYGFFFGAIVVPCNPAFIAALFTKTLSGTSFAVNVLNFISFGVGMGFPLLVFSLISTQKSSAIIGFLTKFKRVINLSAGLMMLVISVYYIIFVFRVFG